MFFKRLEEDARAFVDRDPAARSRWEVMICYPGFHAIVLHRLAHGLWRRGLQFIARCVSQLSRFLTGVEIHPGATIGRRFVIDHGQGVVIGETSHVGDDVTIYQTVTLGGIAPSVDSRAQVSVKRHPTIEDNVIIGSGAQILGPITVGRGARVGANSVVTKDLPPGVTAVGIPAHVVLPSGNGVEPRFRAYGTTAGGCPDPVDEEFEAIRTEMMALAARLADAEAKLRMIEPGPERHDGAAPMDGATAPVHMDGATAPVHMDGATAPVQVIAEAGRH